MKAELTTRSPTIQTIPTTRDMLHYAIVFIIIALVAGFLGFGSRGRPALLVMVGVSQER